MLSITNLWKRGTPPPPAAQADEAALLADVSIPDPAELQRQLRAAEQQRETEDARYARAQVEQQQDPQAWSECAAIAARRPAVTAAITRLRADSAAATIQRRAFLDLARIEAEIDADIAARAEALYKNLLVSTKDERRAALNALHAQIRLRARIVSALAGVSRARRYHRPQADTLTMLKRDLMDRIADLDRMHMPGVPRPEVVWPDRCQELMNTLAKKGTAA